MNMAKKIRYTEMIVRKRKKYYLDIFPKYKLAWWIYKNIKMKNTEKVFIYPGKIVVYEVYTE